MDQRLKDFAVDLPEQGLVLPEQEPVLPERVLVLPVEPADPLVEQVDQLGSAADHLELEADLPVVGTVVHLEAMVDPLVVEVVVVQVAVED